MNEILANSAQIPDRRSGRVCRLALAWTIVWLAGLAYVMATLPIDRTPVIEAGGDNLRRLWPYWIACGGAWIGLTCMWLMLRRSERAAAEHIFTLQQKCEDQNSASDFRRAAALILLVALLVRLVILITHRESLSDDVYRYIYDGRNLAAGLNPYLQIPLNCMNEVEEHWPGERQLLPLITYRELATPYLPISQCVFGALGLVIGDNGSNPASSARVFRAGFVALEIVMMLIMLGALRRAGRSPWWLALYAWHPLPISEIAGSGHQDIIGITFLVATLSMFSARPSKTGGWSALLALSAMGKPFTLPTGAILLRRRPWREWMKSIAVGAVVALLAFAPFWLIWGDGLHAAKNWKKTADELAEKFAHFGGVYEPVVAVVRQVMPAEGQPAGFNLEQEWLARKICFGILVAAGVAIYFSRLNAWNATRAILFALVLLSTTAHPWYLLWAFALTPMANSWALWVLSLTLPWGYAVFADVVHWTVPPWVYVVAYGPVVVALVCDVAGHQRAKPKVNAP